MPLDYFQKGPLTWHLQCFKYCWESLSGISDPIPQSLSSHELVLSFRIAVHLRSGSQWCTNWDALIIEPKTKKKKHKLEGVVVEEDEVVRDLNLKFLPWLLQLKLQRVTFLKKMKEKTASFYFWCVFEKIKGLYCNYRDFVTGGSLSSLDF